MSRLTLNRIEKPCDKWSNDTGTKELLKAGEEKNGAMCILFY